MCIALVYKCDDNILAQCKIKSLGNFCIKHLHNYKLGTIHEISEDGLQIVNTKLIDKYSFVNYIKNQKIIDYENKINVLQDLLKRCNRDDDKEQIIDTIWHYRGEIAFIIAKFKI